MTTETLDMEALLQENRRLTSILETTGGGFPREVLEKRAEGRRLLSEMMATYGAEAEYELTDTVVLDIDNKLGVRAIRPWTYKIQNGRQKIVPTIIQWAFPPNGVMKPVNEAAARIFEAWEMSIFTDGAKIVYAPSTSSDRFPQPIFIRKKESRRHFWRRRAHTRAGCLYWYTHERSVQHRKAQSKTRYLAGCALSFINTWVNPSLPKRLKIRV